MAETPLVVDYSEAWPRQFEEVAQALRAVMPTSEADLEHIGSTAVPGLCAKPVLDLLLGVAALEQAEALIPALAGIGFRYRPEHEAQIPQRRYFVRDAGHGPRVHLHAVVRGGTLWMQHLRFRDRLRENGEWRSAYAQLKRRLAEEHASDKAAYTEAKAPFIRDVLADRAPFGR